jgi:ribonuclease BN (tRNA processing enzyme)
MIGIRVALFLFLILFGIVSWSATCAAWRFDEVAAGVRPLVPREFRVLTAINVGTGGAYENPARLGPSTAIAKGRDVILVDAGRAVADALRGAQLPVYQPDLILLTSLLPENTVGLDDLLFTSWLSDRKTPLRLVGPPGTAVLANHLLLAHRAGLESMAEGLGIPAAPAFEVEEIGEGWTGTQGEISIRAGAMPGGPTPGFGYRFEAGGRSVVVGGPGWAPDALVELARDVDLLIAEAVSVPSVEVATELGIEDTRRLEHEAKLHTPLERIGKVARRANAKSLALVRLRPPPVFDLQVTSIVANDYDGTVIVAKDGDEIEP